MAKSKKKVAKPKKKRADKYDEKLAINGSFEDVIKISTNYTHQKKKRIRKIKSSETSFYEKN